MANYITQYDAIKTAAYYFMPEGSFIAGGALTSVFTGTSINDIDLYFKSKAAFENAVHEAYESNLWCVANTPRAVTFAKDGYILQLMHFDWFETPEAIFDAFDFTCCMAAVNCETGEFTFHEDFLKHASQRFLKFHAGTRFPYGTVTRVLKYQKRGYTIGKGELLRIALKCAATKIESWDDLENHLAGQYGAKANIPANGDFSLDAAISAIDNFEIPERGDAVSMPDNAVDLLASIFGTDD